MATKSVNLNWWGAGFLQEVEPQVFLCLLPLTEPETLFHSLIHSLDHTESSWILYSLEKNDKKNLCCFVSERQIQNKPFFILKRMQSASAVSHAFKSLSFYRNTIHMEA